MFLLVLCFVFVTVGSEGVFIPEFDYASLRPAVLHTLTCPAFIPERPNFTYDQRNTQDVVLLKPKPDFSGLVEGLLCTKLELVTSSEDYMLASCRIIHSTQELPITKAECDLAIAQYEKGEIIDTNYLAPDCSGYSLHIQKKVIVSVKPHAVKFDPYTMMYIDVLFPGGQSPYKYSATVHRSSVWKMSGSNPPCSKFEEIKGELMFATDELNSRGSGIHLWALGIEEQTFEKACKINFCGLVGVLFPNGEWFNIRPSSGVGNSSTVVDRLDPCAGSLEIKSETVNQEVMHSFTTSYQTSMRLWCMDTLEDLNSGIAIPHYRLAYLTPNAVGLGPVYKLVNKTLMMTMGHYKNVRLNSLNQLNIVGTEDKGTEFVIPHNQLTVRPDDGSFEWVNGWIYHEGKWSIPMIDILRNNIHHMLARPLQLTAIQHTVAEYAVPRLDMINQPDVTMYQTKDTGSAGTWVTSYVKHLTTGTKTIFWSAIGITTLLISLGVIKVLIKCQVYKLCQFTLKKHKSRSASEPMNQIVRYQVGSGRVESGSTSTNPDRVVWN